jgi:hypothetical protein
MDPEDLEVFLGNIRTWRPELPVRLEGGELTVIDLEKIERYIQAVKSNGRKLEIITNGYNILRINPFDIDWIVLDEHRQNKKLIKEIKKTYDENGYENYHIVSTPDHYDLSYMIENNNPDCLRCPEYFNSVTLWNKVVYPCCISPMLDSWARLQDRRVRELLIREDWTYDNPDLGYKLENENVSPDLLYAMRSRCWRGKNKGKLYPTDRL